MAFCPPDPDNSKAAVPWIRDPNGAADNLSTDLEGNLCVKLSDGTTSSCVTEFVLAVLPDADTEYTLSSFLGSLSDVLHLNIHNTKLSSRENSLRLATLGGLVATSIEPYLDLGWGCVYEWGRCTGELYLASSFENHTLLIEVFRNV